MAQYRLTTDANEVVAEATHDHDQQAVAWRSAHPFEAPGVDSSRQLHLERLTDDHGWVRLEALGTAEVD